jgi:hypothetical protein
MSVVLGVEEFQETVEDNPERGKLGNHVADAQARLVQQLKNKTKFKALIAALVKPAQALEDAFWDLLTKRSLDVAEGAQLDLCGKIVGEPRQSNDDDTYRAFIGARIKTNKSNGQRETLLAILRALVPFAIKAYTGAPATVLFEIEGPIPVDPYVVMDRFLSRAVSAGIYVQLGWTESAVGNTLTFDSVYGGTDLISTQAPGSEYTTGTGGGVWAGVVSNAP